MKIGIVTFEFNYNYGALLQAYSLVECLKKMGHTAQILNRGWGDLEKRKNLKPTLNTQLSHYLGYYITLRKINDFRKKHLPMTKPINSEEELMNIVSEFDLIVCGSDQIWSSGTVKEMKYYYFGDFAIKKGIPVISYAASMGKSSFDVTPEQKKVIEYLLSKYKAVSCREHQMIPILKELGVINPILVLDPTMIIDRHIFEDLLLNKSIGGG